MQLKKSEKKKISRVEGKKEQVEKGNALRNSRQLLHGDKEQRSLPTPSIAHASREWALSKRERPTLKKMEREMVSVWGKRTFTFGTPILPEDGLASRRGGENLYEAGTQKA